MGYYHRSRYPYRGRRSRGRSPSSQKSKARNQRKLAAYGEWMRFLNQHMAEWDAQNPRVRKPDLLSDFERRAIRKGRAFHFAIRAYKIGTPVLAFLFIFEPFMSRFLIAVAAAITVLFTSSLIKAFMQNRSLGYSCWQDIANWRPTPATCEEDLEHIPSAKDYAAARNAQVETVKQMHRKAIAERGSRMTEMQAVASGLLKEVNGDGGWLYVVSGVYGSRRVVKVGISKRLCRRLDEHDRHGLRKVDALYFFQSYDDARNVENYWKQKFVKRNATVDYCPTETTVDTRDAREFIATYVDVLPTITLNREPSETDEPRQEASSDVWQRSESPFRSEAA